MNQTVKNRVKENKVKEKKRKKGEKHHTTDHKSQVSRGVELRVSEGAITFVPSPRSGRVFGVGKMAQ